MTEALNDQDPEQQQDEIQPDPQEILVEFTAYLSENGLGAAELIGALRGVRPVLTGGEDV